MTNPVTAGEFAEAGAALERAIAAVGEADFHLTKALLLLGAEGKPTVVSATQAIQTQVEAHRTGLRTQTERLRKAIGDLG